MSACWDVMRFLFYSINLLQSRSLYRCGFWKEEVLMLKIGDFVAVMDVIEKYQHTFDNDGNDQGAYVTSATLDLIAPENDHEVADILKEREIRVIDCGPASIKKSTPGLEDYNEDEVQELVILHKERGNIYAFWMIFKLVLPFLKMMYGRRYKDVIEFDEYLSLSVVELRKYIKKYHKTHARFASFFMNVKIPSMVSDFERNKKSIRTGVYQSIAKIKKFQTKFESEYGRTPDDDEIARGTDIPITQIPGLLRTIYQTDTVASLNEAPSENPDGGEILMHTIVDKKTQISYVDSDDFRDKSIYEAVKSLPHDQKIFAVLRYGREWNYQDIQKELGVNDEQIKKIEEWTVDNLRIMLEQFNDSY